MGFRVIGVRGADQKLCGNQTLAVPDNARALVADLLIPGAGRLYSLTCFNTGPTQYLQLFDSGLAVADGGVPEVVVKCLGDDDRSEDFQDGIIFKNGLYICNSTTSGTKTLGAANCLLRVQFRLGR